MSTPKGEIGKVADASGHENGDEVSNESHMTGEALASRLLIIIGGESVASFSRRSGVGESLLRKYLNGSLPNSRNLVLLADAGGCTVDWLATGRSPRMRVDVPASHGLVEETAVAEDEFLLLKRYRDASDDQKTAVRALLEAIANPGGIAWYHVGQAITNIANIFPRKKD